MNLKAARHNRNLTQEEVAKALNVTKKTVGSWENGKTIPGLDKVEALCKLYRLSYDDIDWRP